MTGDSELALVLEQAQSICAIAAPSFAEGPRGEHVAALFAAAGLASRVDAAGNVIVELAGLAGPPVVFAAHLDTVFAAGTPLEFAERGGRLYAPGIGDNSLGVAALLHLGRHLAGPRAAPAVPVSAPPGAPPLGRAVTLVATVGEEGLGDLRGAKVIVDALAMSAFVAVEGSMADSLTIAAVGSIRLRAAVRGPGGHPWGDAERPSAVHGLVSGLAAAIAAVRELGVTCNVGTIQGGTAVNVIGGEASAEIDLRAEDDAALQAGAQAFIAALASAAAGPGAAPDGGAAGDRLQVLVDRIGHRPGGVLPTEHPLLLAARRARASAGLPPAPEQASSTDANAAHGRGIPAITVGITTGDDAHTVREYIDLPPIAAGLHALRALADELVAG